MRLNPLFFSVVGLTLLCGCAHQGTNPDDPFEPFNRKIHKFNMTIDRTLLKPPVKLYRALLPAFVRKGINNFYNNLDMIPTVVNDLLQAEGVWAIKDTWRFAINSTLGVGGFFDFAQHCSLPLHYNDLGLTFAKWGNQHSPYLVIPLLGPSTLRDGAGILFQFALYSPYVYLQSNTLIYSLLGVRYLDLRSQFMDTEQIMDEALDQYSFIRDAYLQHRNFLIGVTRGEDVGVIAPGGDEAGGAPLYVDEEDASSEGGINYVDE